jgi:all-trans-retinol 13,14-reductase
LSTPLSTKHFTGYQKGEIYGINHGPKRFRLDFLRAPTSVRNLYLTGQDIVTVGMRRALFSGVLSVVCDTEKECGEGDTEEVLTMIGMIGVMNAMIISGR